jgi:hypothetical protein
MPIPVATAGADQSFAYSASAITVTLAGSASNGPITAWEWTMLSVPPGSSADSGTNQNFTNGVATIQNPQFDMDVPGCYVLQLKAQNATGWSNPDLDQDGAQTLCFMRTQDFDLEIPGYKAYRYDPYLNGSLLDLETGLAGHHARHENGGADEISVAGLSGTLADPQNPATHAADHEPGGGDTMTVDAAAATGSLRTLGTGAQQACAGNDSRLSDARTPTTHASSHQDGGGDEVATATPGAAAIPKADGSGKLDSWISDAAAGNKGLIQLAEDLGGTAALPTVEGLGGDPLPSDIANGFLKRDTGNANWEEVAYGSAANTVCQGNDSRLSDARTPTSHASSHQDGGADEINVGGLSGELADPQPAKAHNLGGSEHSADTLANLNAKVSDYSLGTDVTAQSSTPLSLTAADSGKVYTNEGASAQIVFNLPAAAVDLNYTFIVQDADGIQIVAATGDTIRIAASVTPAAGNISTTTIGNTVKLIAINATEWIAVFYVGTWTVST